MGTGGLKISITMTGSSPSEGLPSASPPVSQRCEACRRYGRQPRTSNRAPSWGSGRLTVNNRFCLEEFSECDFAPFASVAGHFIAAERGFWIFGGTVDENHTGFKPCSNIVRTLLGGGLYVGS